MPDAFRSISYTGINSFSVISDSQSKEIVAVSNLCFDSAGLGMTKSIPQSLTRNPDNLNVDVWMQRPCRSFNHYTELHGILIAVPRNKFFSQGCDFLR
jgi:hypothetical protein